jgi:hypothetical protein
LVCHPQRRGVADAHRCLERVAMRRCDFLRQRMCRADTPLSAKSNIANRPGNWRCDDVTWPGNKEWGVWS